MSNVESRKNHLRGHQYQIIVCGILDQSWSEWFGGVTLNIELDQDGMPITRLVASLPDQGALRGILNRLWDLNLTLLSVNCIDIQIRR